MPPKSIFRQPGAQHFQLVHRSQRDPLIHDPEASPRVLKPVQRENLVKKGKSRADLESIFTEDDPAIRPNVGEAAIYGIYYDDTEYDYMQHLRPVGTSEEGVESLLIEAPAAPKQVPRPKNKSAITLKDIPSEALASTTELERNYESQQAIPSSIAGFQPDMDPHLRQVLEALEDDAFVDDGLEDDFFGELVKDGERKPDEVIEFEFEEDGELEEDGEGEDHGEEAEDNWEARFAQFKISQKETGNHTSERDGQSEGGDTVGRLPQLSVVGGKRRRKGASDASGYSMSSSSMFRNAGLTALDDQFDQIEKEYNEEAEEEEEEEDGDDDDDDDAPQLVTREDFNSIMDDFLDNYELAGKRLRPVLEGDTSTQKLDTLRRAFGNGGKQDILKKANLDEGSDGEEDEIPMPHDVDVEKERWDCETILSTYTNLENHPRLIRARDLSKVPKIKLDKRTGLPTVEESVAKIPKVKGKQAEESSSEEDDDESNDHARGTIKRDPSESKEEKKARKQAVKQERQARRVDKKALKEAFSAERKVQVKGLNLQAKQAGVTKL